MPADEPYGTHALPPPLAALRDAVGRMPPGRAGRLLASGVRRMCVLGRRGPVDLEAFEGARVRLWPRTNRCEKALLTGAGYFDPVERAAIAAHLAASPADRPFAFVDLGANVGLYTLSLLAAARAAGRAVRAVAVEPDAVNRLRLEANLAFSGFSAEVVPVAIAAADGTVRMVSDGRNRGEIRVAAASAGDGETVEALSIASLCARVGLARIDAMKVDIEGEDRAALAAFFAEADEAAWPGLLVVEVGREDAAGIAGLAAAAGYRLAGRTRLNAILARTGTGDTH